MKRALYLALTLTFTLVGCGKKQATNAGAEAQFETLSEQVESLSTTNRSVVRRNADDALNLSAENILNTLYGTNAQVTRVAIAGVGTSTNFPVAKANLVIYDKDASGQFQLTSGNPTTIRNISPAALAIFAATGVVPLAAGGAGFCAGSNGQAIQSGAFALGLGLTNRGYLVGVAGVVFRSGNQYQACSNYGCTKVTTVPLVLQQFFPSCASLMQ